MKEIEKLAVKYFLVLVGLRLLNYVISTYLPRLLLSISPDLYLEFNYHILLSVGYILDLVLALVIFVDARKMIKNWVLVPVITYFMPVFGIAFFLIEKFSLQNFPHHE